MEDGPLVEPCGYSLIVVPYVSCKGVAGSGGLVYRSQPGAGSPKDGQWSQFLGIFVFRGWRLPAAAVVGGEWLMALEFRLLDTISREVNRTRLASLFRDYSYSTGKLRRTIGASAAVILLAKS